jgi:acyl-coenzyme A synthetase/AMP-(fatty) acid ligase
MTYDRDPESSSRWWKPVNFGWKYFNYIIVVVGFIVGFAVWVLPNQWADPEVQAGMARIMERQKLAMEWAAQKALIEAEEARIAKENEELGLIYIDPGTNPFLPPDSQREPAQPTPQQ